MEEKTEEYIKGYEQGIKDFAERLQRYYRHVPGNTYSVLVAYTAEEMAKALKEKQAK